MVDIDELRMLAEDLPVNGYNRYATAMSQAADRLEAAEKDITLKEGVIDSLGLMLNVVSNERDVLRDRLALESQENGALRDSVDRACEERDELRARIEEAENDAAHQKALAASALRVAEGWERKCGELRAKIAEMEKRLRLILEEPENTMSNSKAMREMIRQARLALEESK